MELTFIICQKNYLELGYFDTHCITIDAQILYHLGYSLCFADAAIPSLLYPGFVNLIKISHL